MYIIHLVLLDNNETGIFALWHHNNNASVLPATISMQRDGSDRWRDMHPRYDFIASSECLLWITNTNSETGTTIRTNEERYDIHVLYDINTLCTCSTSIIEKRILNLIESSVNTMGIASCAVQTALCFLGEYYEVPL